MNPQSNIIELKVDGMDCANCAAGIDRFLNSKGLSDVFVNFATGEVRFALGNSALTIPKVEEGIHSLGYRIIHADSPEPWWNLKRKLLISSIFTAPLFFLHLFMVLGIPYPALLDNPYVQLLLCLPVYLIGLFHFGKSAWSAVSHGTTNMDVLIFIGSTAAFIYSLIGTYIGEPNYIFYETAATIITLVLIGNWLEHRSVQQTTTAIDDLSQLQVENASKVLHSGTLVNLPIEDIQIGDILQVNEGDTVPLDGTLISGSGSIDESMLTGESLPVFRKKGQQVVGASLVKEGNFRMQVTATGKETLLNKIIEIVKTAQQDKPKIQKLADQISAWFVPIVLGISVLTLVLSYFFFAIPFGTALMNSIAVLVISCPCAMGLATPTAVTVGIGRMAKEGILVKGGQTLETFGQIEQFVFDKTGTLTTGEFEVQKIDYKNNDPTTIHNLIYTLESYSSHPIAQSLVKEMREKEATSVFLKEVNEKRGLGMEAIDTAGNTYTLGAASSSNGVHHLSLKKNQEVLADISIADELRTDAADAMSYLAQKDFSTYLLSGDQENKVQQVASKLGIDTYYAAKKPAEKLAIIGELAKKAPTAMVGDGINDAPALAKATIGVSLSGASKAAIQSAQIILLNNRLSSLTKAIGISKATLLTIKQNLFWAFAYNIVAIPMAALGFLSPMWAALFMAFSDVVVIGNSIRLKSKKID